MYVKLSTMKIKRDFIIMNMIAYLFFWILASFNYNNPDYIGYKESYENAGNSFEQIYSDIIIFFRSIGFSYGQYLVVLGIFVSILYCCAIRYHTNAHWAVLFCVAVSPLGLLVTQVRCFLGYAILYCAINMLLEGYCKSEKPKISILLGYTMMVFLSAGIQSTILFFLIFLFSKFVSIKKMIVSVVIFVFIFSYFFGNQELLVWFLKKIDFIIPISKTYFYLVSPHIRPNIKGLFATYTLYAVGLFSLLVLLRNEYKTVNKKISFFHYCNNASTINGFFFRCYLMISVILPFDTIDTTFERFYFYMFPYIYMLFVSAIEKASSKSIKINLSVFLLLMIAFGLFYMIYVNGNLDSIVIPMIRDNYIFNPKTWLS